MANEDSKEKKIISSIPPSAYDSTVEMVREVLRLHDIDVGTVKPAIVESYDRTTHVATVRLLIKDVFASRDGDCYKDVAPVIVPVLRFQHGMFLADAPLYPGDTGYVVAGHRDGSLAVEGNSKPVLEAGADGKAQSNNLGPQPPNTYLLHRYENGFFVPCRWGTVEVDEKDKDSLVLARYRNQTKEIERDGKKVEVYDGVEGKVTLEKDGTVRIVNGTGLVVEPVDAAASPRQNDDGSTSEQRGEDAASTRKPTVYIDPTADLTTTDARFREAIVLSKETNAETGKSRFVYRKHRILADEGEKAENSELGGVGGSGNAYFSIYAPEGRDGYSIRAGRVCVDDDQFLDVDEPEEALDPKKEYFCCVKIVRDSGLIAGAEIVSFDKIEKKENESDKEREKRLEKERKQFEEYAPEDFDTCRRWIVPIGSVDEDGNITQRHVGAINLSSDAQERPDFKIYVSGYDTAAKMYTYDIAVGTVQANGKTATAEAVMGIALDTDYWCKVTYKVSDQTLEAEITSTEPTYPDDDATIVWKVKIGRATATEIQQLHIGTLSLALPNHSLKVNGTEQAKFFGTKDVDIVLSDSDTINFSSFSCRRTQIGGTQCEFFLPSGSAYVNGNPVDFTQNFTTTTGDWKTPNGITTSGTIYCWIGISSYASNATHYAHFSTAAKAVGSKEGNENVEVCFKVCEIGNAGNQTVIDGISQIASGTMYFTMHDDFAFKVEKVGGNWEIYLPDDAVVRLHKSETVSDNGRVLITALTRDANMQAAASGRAGWYALPAGVAAGTSIYAEFEQDKESGDDGQYKRNFLSYKIVTVPTVGKEKIKVAQIIGGALNEVTQIVSSSIVLKEDSQCVDSITGDFEGSEKISGDVIITGTANDEYGTSCGIEFLTVSERAAQGEDPATPAKIIARIKDRDTSEDDWGAHSITYTDSGGETRTAHILASEDIDIQGGSGSLDDVSVTTKSFVVGVPFTSKKTSAAGVVSFQLTIGSDPEDEDPSEEGGDNYCNGLSDDGICGILTGGNDISANGFESENQFGSGGFGAGGNGISNTPCVNNNELT